jgi:hypothetical protein
MPALETFGHFRSFPENSPFSMLHTSTVTLLAGLRHWLSSACRLHTALHLASSPFKLSRTFPGNNGHFLRFEGKVAFSLLCTSAVTVLVRLLHRLKPGCRLRMTLCTCLLFSQVLANISRKQWAFKKFPGRSRLFLDAPVRGDFLCGYCIGS